VSNSENDDEVLVTRDPIPVIFNRIATGKIHLSSNSDAEKVERTDISPERKANQQPSRFRVNFTEIFQWFSTLVKALLA